MTIENAIGHLNKNFHKHLDDLKKLVRIPSVSFPGFDHGAIDKTAEAVKGLLIETGLENVQVLKQDGMFPFVYGDHLHAKGAPTVLLYAHHDVQPVGRKELWQTEPFEPTEKKGPHGLRLYGRGAADDKAGIVVHTAAIASCLQTLGRLPVNVKILIEGEEEIGSPNLAKFLNTYKDLVQADIMILTDTANYDCGVPSLTVGLRGLVAFEVEVRALSKAIHSGLWGGPIPDPVMGLSKALASLVDEAGNIAVPEIQSLMKPLPDSVKKELEKIPFDEKTFREQSGMVAGAQFVQKNISPLAALWNYPSLMITAIQASSRAQAGNIINDVAWAKVTMRIPQAMDPEKSCDALMGHIQKNVPWGLEVKLHKEVAAGGWSTDPFSENNKAAFAAAYLALEKGYGRKVVSTGCGATIPFVQPFVKALQGAPALLIGIEDPYTNAHGENESLLISDFKKTIASEIYMFEEFGKL